MKTTLAEKISIKEFKGQKKNFAMKSQLEDVLRLLDEKEAYSSKNVKTAKKDFKEFRKGFESDQIKLAQTV